MLVQINGERIGSVETRLPTTPCSTTLDNAGIRPRSSNGEISRQSAESQPTSNTFRFSAREKSSIKLEGRMATSCRSCLPKRSEKIQITLWLEDGVARAT